jgi:hypothetical protein
MDTVTAYPEARLNFAPRRLLDHAIIAPKIDLFNPLDPPILGEGRRTGDTPVPLAGSILHLFPIEL